jgi:signal transduction histidine kinase
VRKLCAAAFHETELGSPTIVRDFLGRGIAMKRADDGRSVIATGMQVAIVALSYIVVAKIGLGLDAVGGFATLVWAASGIGLASILLGGFKLWPAITIGAFIVNYLSGASIPAALGIAFGNTAEAVTGAYLLMRFGFRNTLDRVRDVLAMIAFGAALSPLVAATIGVSSLLAFNVISPTGYIEAWKAWWVGDAIGNLLVAPLILGWATWTPRFRANRVAEAVIVVLFVIATSMMVFTPSPAADEVARGREYMLFPPLVWAALRFGIRGSVTATVVATAIAVVYTSLGHGPFVRTDLHQNLFDLQIFVAVCGATLLLLGASIAERQNTTLELEKARETAESANRAKSGFLAVVSHELRTPLNAIMGYVELLLLELDGPLTSGQRSILERIRQSQRHLLALIEDVLGFAQVEAGRLSFTLQPVSVSDALMTIEPIIAHEAEKKGLHLHISETDPALVAFADPHKLRQVILNLTTNAIKFTPEGGFVSVTAERTADTVVIKVSDTGIGISRENVTHVFDPFFQVDQGGTRRFPGVGLGLAIVRDTVLAMNGDAGIESELGKGTTVTVRLPAAGSQPPSEIGQSTPKLAASDSSMAEPPRAAMQP